MRTKMMTPWKTTLLACTFLAALGRLGTAAVGQTQIGQKVACVGDSITAGVGASRAENNYPGLLAKMLGPQYVVGNFGESGATLLQHGDSPYRQRGGYAAGAAFAPNTVIIMLGTNDSKPQNWAHRDEFAADYAALLDYYAALPTHPRLFVCLPPPVPKANYGINEEAVALELPLIRRVAAQKGATVIDVHGRVPNDTADFVDGVHPNDAGYVQLASAVYQGLTRAPIILPVGGRPFYEQTQVTIKPPTPDAQVRYTTDGSAPTAASALYKFPFNVKRTTTVRAQAFMAQGPAGPVNTATFTRVMPLAAHTPAHLAPGLRYAYFEAPFQNTASFTGRTPLARGVVPDFRLTPHRREADFGIKFDGFVDAPVQGLYTFGTESDDGSKLLIDGRPIVDNDGIHGAQAATGQVALARGGHAITVLYFQGTGGSGLRVTWQGPNFPTRDIPATALSHAP